LGEAADAKQWRSNGVGRVGKVQGAPNEGAPSSSSRDKVTKRRRGKERVEWGRGPWRAVLAFLPRGFRVPSYATDAKTFYIIGKCNTVHSGGCSCTEDVENNRTIFIRKSVT